jgi:methylase of polypeptide subunit release factors
MDRSRRNDGPRVSDLVQLRAALLKALQERAYSFITPTPATHARVLARDQKQAAHDLRDVFGWSLPFAQGVIANDLVALMRSAEMLDRRGDRFVSRFRVSSLGDDLVLHSAYPTIQPDSVFFGPDSYRFAAFLHAELPRFGAAEHLIDVGAGAGVGALAALRSIPIACLTLTDINPAALALARANLTHAGRTEGVNFLLTDALKDASAAPDVIVANPPYIIDDAHRTYRDGGGMHGAEISLAWAKAAAAKLSQGGALLLYTGSAIVNGEDRFKAALHEALSDFDITYRELDPDVFGEELERDAYADVDRIAVIGAVAVKR